MSPSAPPADVAKDGRDARWEAHRAVRRRELVEAALRAIRAHGPGVGMDEIATQARTSKTVLYRHLGDRAGVYRAVVEAVDGLILADLGEARRQGAGDVVAQLGAMVRAYLLLVERDPEIYRFVMTRPLDTSETDPSDPVHQLTDRLGEELADTIADHLVRTGQADRAALLAPVWGHGIVGFVRQAADHWLTRKTSTDPELAIDDVTRAAVELFRPALSATPTGAPA